MIHTQDEDFTLYVGDVREQLANLPDQSVHMVCTSPPYWGLRDYGTGQWDGGNPDCDHVAGKTRNDAARVFPTAGPDRRGSFAQAEDQYRDVCGRCGARRVDQQLGLEATPDLYVARMVDVFREVRRVLRDDGTCWVNLGDSYGAGSRTTSAAQTIHNGEMRQKYEGRVAGIASKQLVGIPWRVAFALQADGWYLRADVIWAKPNPMPESVTDRPTKSHEYVFLLSKRPRYFFDQEAVREKYQADHTWDAFRGGHTETSAYTEQKGPQNNSARGPDGRRNTRVVGADGSIQHRDGERWPNGGRNVRSVWEIATQPYPEAHFATFPEELARRCILAGTSERGVCPECGAPWEREVERGESDYARLKREHGHTWNDMDAAGLERGVIIREGEGGQTRKPNGTVPSLRAADTRHVGWRPTCGCGTGDVPEVQHDDVDAEPVRGAVPVLRPHPPVPSVVLDPFLGSGTVAHVARKHGRRSIGIDLNPAYAELAARRLSQLSLLA